MVAAILKKKQLFKKNWKNQKCYTLSWKFVRQPFFEKTILNFSEIYWNYFGEFFQKIWTNYQVFYTMSWNKDKVFICPKSLFLHNWNLWFFRLNNFPKNLKTLFWRTNTAFCFRTLWRIIMRINRFLKNNDIFSDIFQKFIKIWISINS